MSSVKVVSSFWCLEFAAIGEGEVSDDGERRHGGKGEERRVRIGQAQNTLRRFATERETKENEQNRAFIEDRVSEHPIWKQAGLPRSRKDKRFGCQDVRKTKETT